MDNVTYTNPDSIEVNEATGYEKNSDGYLGSELEVSSCTVEEESGTDKSDVKKNRLRTTMPPYKLKPAEIEGLKLLNSAQANEKEIKILFDEAKKSLEEAERYFESVKVRVKQAEKMTLKTAEEVCDLLSKEP